MFFFFQAEDGIRDGRVTGVQTCALPISIPAHSESTSLKRSRRRYKRQELRGKSKVSSSLSVFNYSFDFQCAKVFEVELADQVRDHVHAHTFLIRAFRMFSPQAEKFINAPL